MRKGLRGEKGKMIGKGSFFPRLWEKNGGHSACPLAVNHRIQIKDLNKKREEEMRRIFCRWGHGVKAISGYMTHPNVRETKPKIREEK